MNRFAIIRPDSLSAAAAVFATDRFSLPVLKAGGMDVLDHLKEGLLEPDALVDVKRLRAGEGERIAAMGDDGATIRIEATATLAEICDAPLVRRRAPVVAQALVRAATPQVRNVATAAGNLLQRPRCWYYRHEQFHCLKKGGHTCFAVEGENRHHAIFGPGPCHIVHPSNLAVALAVCGGAVHLTGSTRPMIPVGALYHTPDRGLLDEHDLEAGEVITHLTFEAAPRSGFFAIKEKQSFDWPLVMAAVALDLSGTTIASARVCAGAVAPVPWRLPEVERGLRGVDVGDEAAVREACAAAADGARPLSANGYKAKLLPVAVRRAVRRAAGREDAET